MRYESLETESQGKLFFTCDSCYYFRYETELDGWGGPGWSSPCSDGVCFVEPKSIQIKNSRPACARWKHYGDGVMDYQEYSSCFPWSSNINNVREALDLTSPVCMEV